MDKIIPVYKKIGETPLEAIDRLRKINPDLEKEKLGYAGRLDPMAEGLLLVMAGEANKKRENFLKLSKKYRLQILFGFETDTMDLLGIVSKKCIFKKPDKINEIIASFKGKFKQKYPAYSSKPVKGKPLFQWAREGLLNQIKTPEHDVEIYDIKKVEEFEISSTKLFSTIKERIKLVKGDFRQKDILDKWNNVLSEHADAYFKILDLEVNCSSGTYMRVLAQDFATKTKSCGLAFAIKRVGVGDYKLESL